MSLIKRLINNSGSPQQLLNRTINNAESWDVPPHLWLEASQNDTIESLVSNGSIIVNDGTNNLSISEGLELLKRFQFDNASKISFNNTTNDFISNNVQDAIEEAQNTAISFSRFTIVCTFNGTVGNNQWLGYDNLLPGNQIPIRLAINCRLREISFSYTQTSLLGLPLSSENIDGTFTLFKNGLTDPTHVVSTIIFNNQAGGKIVTGLNINFNSGDFMVGKWTDQGDNPSDLAIVYYFEPIVV